MEDSKNKALNQIRKKIDELKNQEKIVENLKIKAVDIEEWSLICETPLRYDDSLLEIAKKTFPLGEDFQRGPNEIFFNIKGINIEVPTYRSATVKIDMNWFNKIEQEYKPINRYSNMRKYFGLIDSGESNWFKLAQLRRTNYKNKVGLFIWWYTEGKWKKIDREKWQEAFSREDKNNETSINKQKELNNEVRKKLEILKTYVLPEISRFSNYKVFFKNTYLSQDDLMNLISEGEEKDNG